MALDTGVPRHTHLSGCSLQFFSSALDFTLQIYSYEVVYTEDRRHTYQELCSAIFQEEFQTKGTDIYGTALEQLTFLDVPYHLGNLLFLSSGPI